MCSSIGNPRQGLTRFNLFELYKNNGSLLSIGIKFVLASLSMGSRDASGQFAIESETHSLAEVWSEQGFDKMPR